MRAWPSDSSKMSFVPSIFSKRVTRSTIVSTNFLQSRESRRSPRYRLPKRLYKRLRILIDESLPGLLAPELVGHEAFSVRQKGWNGLRNGVLLRAAVEA